MNYFDIIFICILLWSVYTGFTKGLIIQAASLIALLLGVFGAIKFSDITSEILIKNLEFSSKYLSLISFAITFVVIVVAVHLLARILDKLVKAVALGFINRLMGVGFSIIKTAFIISIILVILNNFNKKSHFLPEDKVNESILYMPLSNFAPIIFPYLDFNSIKEEIEERVDFEKITDT